MRWLITILIAGMMLGTAHAKPKQHNLKPITLGTNTTGTSTIALSGYVEAVHVSVSDGASTGTATVAYAPHTGSTAISIATGSTVDEKVWRPATDRTAVAGTALTNDPPGRFALAGETVTFTIASSPTGLVWYCVIVTEESK